MMEAAIFVAMHCLKSGEVGLALSRLWGQWKNPDNLAIIVENFFVTVIRLTNRFVKKLADYKNPESLQH